jgi:hypothetical protein
MMTNLLYIYYIFDRLSACEKLQSWDNLLDVKMSMDYQWIQIQVFIF